MNATQAARQFAAISLGAITVFLWLIGVLHVIKPEFDPSWRFLSEYSIGTHGWVMMLAFFTWALSCFALSVSLREDAVSFAGRLGRVVLVVVAVSQIAAGLFAQDPVTAKPDELTTHGALHAVASLIGIPGIPIAALLISLSLTHNNPAWFTRRRVMMATAHLTWLSLVAMFVYLAVAVPAAGGFGPGVQAGWMNRLVVLTYCAWQIVTSYSSYRIHGK
jgi:hypothetical protein